MKIKPQRTRNIWLNELPRRRMKYTKEGEKRGKRFLMLISPHFAKSYFPLGTVYLITLAQCRSSCGAVAHKSKTGKGVKCFYSVRRRQRRLEEFLVKKIVFIFKSIRFAQFW